MASLNNNVSQHDSMTIAIEFSTIEARDAFLQDAPPEGLDFYIEAANEGGIIATSFIILADVIKPIAAGLIARFIYDRVAKCDAKRVLIDDREPVDRADFERTLVDGLEIGKND